MKMTTEPKQQILQIDCPPGYPRPSDLLPQVLKGTGVEPREHISTFFGNFTWDFSDVDPKMWEEARKIIGPRLIQLDKDAVTRYASW